MPNVCNVVTAIKVFAGFPAPPFLFMYAQIPSVHLLKQILSKLYFGHAGHVYDRQAVRKDRNSA